MEKKQEDRRTRYSKRVIREALYELMKERPLNKITVTQICETADVNRSTFYAYYTDIYDLHTSIIKEFYGLQRVFMNRALAVLEGKDDITALTVAEFREISSIYLETVRENKDLTSSFSTGTACRKSWTAFTRCSFRSSKKGRRPRCTCTSGIPSAL